MQLRAKGNAIRNRLKLEGDDVVKFEENTTKICPTSRDLVSGSVLAMAFRLQIKAELYCSRLYGTDLSYGDFAILQRLN